MIRVTVKKAAIAKKVYTPAELARRMGVQDVIAGRLWNSTDYNAKLGTIDSVVTALGCKLSDVLVYEPNGARSPARRNGSAVKTAGKAKK